MDPPESERFLRRVLDLAGSQQLDSVSIFGPASRGPKSVADWKTFWHERDASIGEGRGPLRRGPPGFAPEN